MNNIIIIGRLTKDPDMRVSGETIVTKFTLAVNREYKGKDEIEVDFFNIATFGRVAENCNKYLSKGLLVGVQGRLQNNHYQDKEGVKHYREQIITDRVEFLQRKKNGENEEAFEENTSYNTLLDDDIPFS